MPRSGSAPDALIWSSGYDDQKLRHLQSLGIVGAMLLDRHIAISAGWIGGPAFGVAMMAAPDYLKLGPSASAWAFWSGISIFALTIIVVFFLSVREKGRRMEFGPLLTMSLGLLILFCGAAWHFWPKSAIPVEATVTIPAQEVQMNSDGSLPPEEIFNRKKILWNIGRDALMGGDRQALNPTVEWYNQQLSIKGIPWRVTDENFETLKTTGMLMENSKIQGGQFGVMLHNSSGNLFEGGSIHGTTSGVMLDNSDSNAFKGVDINKPK